MTVELCGLFPGDHVRQDSMDFSKEWEDPANCRCSDRLKPLERRKARQHQRCLAHSLVGTPNYIAPEVLLRTGTVDHICRLYCAIKRWILLFFSFQNLDRLVSLKCSILSMACMSLRAHTSHTKIEALS